MERGSADRRAASLGEWNTQYEHFRSRNWAHFRALSFPWPLLRQRGDRAKLHGDRVWQCDRHHGFRVWALRRLPERTAWMGQLWRITTDFHGHGERHLRDRPL